MRAARRSVVSALAPWYKHEERPDPLITYAGIQERAGVTGGQHRAFRAMGPVVPQHSGQQCLADTATPVRRLNIHVRAPCRSHSIHAAHAPNDLLSVECYILPEGGIIFEQMV